ncbi:hypothetical protein DQ384_36375 [Sphaerisporangium album]|uniref:SWIM-type domain-containing protein n=1 Tax=Sphaerisporangium album TaxID=509200 RepID=A0A367EW67_9ACTN|nr:hypothetical protein [Sphaerisporangium album]RCG21939.1 hypothetical protein DQ384_36375 [Sphaerisporangium album]
MAVDVRSKALGYLRSGAVRVLVASTMGPARRPYFVEAHVDGHQSTYIVRFELHEWTCTCHEADCAHAAAVQLATGHESAAAPSRTPKGGS